jgi:predicted dehydrogenase
MPQSLSRRSFLGAAAGAGIALSTPSARAYRSILGANDKIVLAMIGTGGRGRDLSKAFSGRPGAEIAYVCDVDKRQVEKAAAVVSKAKDGATPKTAGDFRSILQDKGVDAVVVATCNHWHAPVAIMACAAGKHVYVEKPCSHNPHEGELMVAAARKHKRVVQMGNQRRSWPEMIAAIEKIRNGSAIGRAYHAQCWYTNTRPSIGTGKEMAPPKELDYDLWQGPAPRRAFHDNYLHYNWHWFWNWGNGELGNNGVHFVDLCRWGLGVNYPVQVTSSGGRYRYSDDQETPDTNTATWQFDGGKSIAWEGFSCSKLPNGKFPDILFHGEKGTLAISGDNYTTYDAKGKEVESIKGKGRDDMHYENFLQSVRGSARLNSEIEEGHKTTMLCHLGNIAYRMKRELRCDPTNGRILNDQQAMGLWKREYQPGFEAEMTADLRAGI